MENTEFTNYQERIFSAYQYYSLSRKLNNTWRICIELKEDVNVMYLIEAIGQTMKRYPYLLVKRKNTYRETVLVYNPEPIKVVKGHEPVRLGGAESNGHLLAVTYEDKTIYLNGFHGLLDGQGVFAVIKTLLYYYCKVAYDPNLSSEGIRVVGDEIVTEEYTDPFPKSIPKNYKSLVKRPLVPNAFHLRNDKRVHPGKKRQCVIRVDETELMRFCRTNDGSPAVLVSVAMARAIAELNPKRRKSIFAGLVLNLRPAIQSPLAHHSLIDVIPLEFTKKLQSCSFDMQNTAFRSQVFLNSDTETVVKNLEYACRTFNIMQKVPSIAMKRLVFGASVNTQFAANTFMLSYVGKIDFGATHQYVNAISIDVDSPNIGIMIELTAINGYFNICIMCDFPEELYIDAFCKQLDELGIQYERGENKPLLTPKCTY